MQTRREPILDESTDAMQERIASRRREALLQQDVRRRIAETRPFLGEVQATLGTTAHSIYNSDLDGWDPGLLKAKTIELFEASRAMLLLEYEHGGIQTKIGIATQQKNTALNPYVKPSVVGPVFHPLRVLSYTTELVVFNSTDRRITAALQGSARHFRQRILDLPLEKAQGLSTTCFVSWNNDGVVLKLQGIGHRNFNDLVIRLGRVSTIDIFSEPLNQALQRQYREQIQAWKQGWDEMLADKNEQYFHRYGILPYNPLVHTPENALLFLRESTASQAEKHYTDYFANARWEYLQEHPMPQSPGHVPGISYASVLDWFDDDEGSRLEAMSGALLAVQPDARNTLYPDSEARITRVLMVTA